MAVTVDLPLVPVTAMVRVRGHVAGEQLAAVQDGHALGLGRAHIRHAIFHGRADDHRVAARFIEGAAVLGHDPDADRLEGGTDLGALALVEGPVATGDPAAGQGVELGQRAHAAAADAGEVEPGRGVGADIAPDPIGRFR